MKDKKIILFGGSFDPVHPGHTAVVLAAAEYLCANKVIFIPAKRSPLKKQFPGASDKDRLAMIDIVIAGNKKFSVSDYEINKQSPCYTLETVRRFCSEYGRSSILHWLTGSDCVDELPCWYEITNLIDECNLSVMHRAGYPEPDFSKFEKLWGKERIKKLAGNVIPTPLVNISSTEIRQRLAEGMDVMNMLHPAVIDYIYEHGLYGCKTKS